VGILMNANANDRSHARAESADPQERRAILVLKGISEVPAHAILDVAERLRQAVRTIGIADVRVEVKLEAEPPAP
jgi:hypothetical protein